jgi:hypothetical protein
LECTDKFIRKLQYEISWKSLQRFSACCRQMDGMSFRRKTGTHDKTDKKIFETFHCEYKKKKALSFAKSTEFNLGPAISHSYFRSPLTPSCLCQRRLLHRGQLIPLRHQMEGYRKVFYL